MANQLTQIPQSTWATKRIQGVGRTVPSDSGNYVQPQCDGEVAITFLLLLSSPAMRCASSSRQPSIDISSRWSYLLWSGLSLHKIVINKSRLWLRFNRSNNELQKLTDEIGSITFEKLNFCVLLPEVGYVLELLWFSYSSSIGSGKLWNIGKRAASEQFIRGNKIALGGGRSSITRQIVQPRINNNNFIRIKLKRDRVVSGFTVWKCKSMLQIILFIGINWKTKPN